MQHATTFNPTLFRDRQVLVTGGTSGIGAAIAPAVRRAGRLGAGRRPRRGRHADTAPPADPPAGTGRERRRRAGGASRASRLDAGHCAGISRDREEYQPASFERVLQVNLVAAMGASQCARELLARQCSIINIASMFSTFGSADRPPTAPASAIVRASRWPSSTRPSASASTPSPRAGSTRPWAPGSRPMPPPPGGSCSARHWSAGASPPSGRCRGLPLQPGGQLHHRRRARRGWRLPLHLSLTDPHPIRDPRPGRDPAAQRTATTTRKDRSP